MAISNEVCKLLSQKRARKRLRRTARCRAKERAKRRRNHEHALRFGVRSQIIERLAKSCHQVITENRPHLVAKVPRVFSIIEDPARSIAWVLQFSKNVRNAVVKTVEIDQSSLATYDLAANALLDIVAYEAKKERRNRGRKLLFSGKYPRDPAIVRFVRSMGVVKHLNIKHELPSSSEVANLRLFDRRSRHYDPKQDPTKADAKAKAVVGFVDHFNECLKDHKRALTPESRAKLCDYVSEILCNAEDHPGFVDWTVQGYLDNSLETPICEIAIFNFGKSIAQTLKELPSGTYTRDQIDPYIMLHAGRNLFGVEWSQSDLLTLIALQGHVSSKNENSSDTRGQGTGDLIDFFQRVHHECASVSSVCAKMAIVSGSTYILFDGTYQMREMGKRGRVIAFNRANDLYSKPDSKFVRSLNGVHFPGTIISIRFPLSAASTVTLGDKENEPTSDY